MADFLQTRLAQLRKAVRAVNRRIRATRQELAQRREQLQGRIAGDRALRTRLLAEQRALKKARPLEVADRTFLLATGAWLMQAAIPDDVLAVVQSDPVLSALQSESSITPDVAVAVTIHRPPTSDPLAYLEQVRAAAALSDEVFTALVIAGHRRWFAQHEGRPYLYQDVGVLLPVRLETLFEPEGEGWRMYLRVVPDEASIKRHKPTVTAAELESLEAMWQEIYANLPDSNAPIDTWLETDQGKLAWDRLCRQVGSGRAAWLAVACPFQVEHDVVKVAPPPSGEPDVPFLNRVGGFPPEIVVYASFDDGPVTELARMAVKTEELILDLSQAAGEKEQWWVSWDKAKAVGLGVETILPDGHTPEEISVLYVVGIGDEHPAGHFQAQVAAGEMAILNPGTPTNTVNGRPAADLGKDPTTWRAVARKRLRRQAGQTVGYSSRTVSAALTGDDETLPSMPGDENAGQAYSGLLVGLLWTALWGHFLKDVWGFDEAAQRVGLWASRYLRPEGFLPPIRIDDQPYGLLPATSLRRWQHAGDQVDAEVEDRLREQTLQVRGDFAAAARARGNAVGAKAAGLFDLISRTATTEQYVYRRFYPYEFLDLVYSTSIGWDVRDALREWRERQFKPTVEMLRREPNRYYLAYGDLADVRIPLVVPNPRIVDGEPVELPMREIFHIILDSRTFSELRERLRNWLPDSLLLRLMIYARWHNAAAVAQTIIPDRDPLLEPLVTDTTQATRVEVLGDRFVPPDVDSPAWQLYIACEEAFVELINRMPEQGTPQWHAFVSELERALRATLDTASHRIDPWIMGMAWRRLEEVQGRSTARYRLGIYGWVDGPIRGKAGPTEGGLINAPSYDQALTGAILRDRFVNEKLEATDPAARNPWDMQLESRLVRMVDELAEEVRLGSHIHEVLGRQVERIVARPADVRTLRTQHPLRPDRFDQNVTCHGQEALKALLAGADGIALSLEQTGDLEWLSRAVDAYGDLLVAEGVQQVIGGHADAASAAMDAAAGLKLPPTLEVIRSPRNGYPLTSSVIAVLPFRAAPPEIDTSLSPGRIADASVADFLIGALGDATAWTWQTEDRARTVMLQDLALEPIDTVVLSKDTLEGLVRFKLDVAADVALAGNGGDKHRLARQLVQALGSQPALFHDLTRADAAPEELAAAAQRDRAAVAEVHDRYQALHMAAGLMVSELDAAADAAAHAQALFRALRWGITPTVSEAQQPALLAALLAGQAPVDDPNLLSTLVKQASETLSARLRAAPDPIAPPGLPVAIARAIAELAAPEGQLAVLSKLGAQDVQQQTRIATGAPDTTLDDTWLTVVATVRPPLAHVEALQLEASAEGVIAPLTAWSSAPGDPWQTAVVQRNEAQRQATEWRTTDVEMPRFVAAYGPGDAWSGPDVAVGLVDSWSEVVPISRHVTTAAFGFNGPAAQAPQAILIAAPPDPAQALDAATLLDIVDETRELAHARAVRYEDLADYQTLAPTMLFQAVGYTGMRLDPGTQFER